MLQQSGRHKIGLSRTEKALSIKNGFVCGPASFIPERWEIRFLRLSSYERRDFLPGLSCFRIILFGATLNETYYCTHKASIYLQLIYLWFLFYMRENVYLFWIYKLHNAYLNILIASFILVVVQTVQNFFFGTL